MDKQTESEHEIEKGQSSSKPSTELDETFLDQEDNADSENE